MQNFVLGSHELWFNIGQVILYTFGECHTVMHSEERIPINVTLWFIIYSPERLWLTKQNGTCEMNCLWVSLNILCLLDVHVPEGTKL